MSKSVNVSVELGGRVRNSHQLIRLFIKKCKEEGIVREYKKTLLHETKGQRRRRKKHEGERRVKAKTEVRENQKKRKKKKKNK